MIRTERASGAATVTHEEVKETLLQKNRFLFEWKNEGKIIPMAIEVAIVTELMATKKEKIDARNFTAGQENRCQSWVRE